MRERVRCSCFYPLSLSVLILCFSFFLFRPWCASSRAAAASAQPPHRAAWQWWCAGRGGRLLVVEPVRHPLKLKQQHIELLARLQQRSAGRAQRAALATTTAATAVAAAAAAASAAARLRLAAQREPRVAGGPELLLRAGGRGGRAAGREAVVQPRLQKRTRPPVEEAALRAYSGWSFSLPRAAVRLAGPLAAPLRLRSPLSRLHVDVHACSQLAP